MFAAQKNMPSLHQGSSEESENRWSNLTAQLLKWPHYNLHCPVL
jgi:hypothetical protein